jgi:hypothetical protein
VSAGDELRRIAERAGTIGGRAAATALADEGQRGIRAQLTKRSHPRRTPTPSPAGQPPAKISGELARGVVTIRAVQVGPHRWSSAAGPTAVYARIQDKGGRAGRNHAATLPPRPYMAPAERAMSARAGDIAQGAFYRAVFG